MLYLVRIILFHQLHLFFIFGYWHFYIFSCSLQSAALAEWRLVVKTLYSFRHHHL